MRILSKQVLASANVYSHKPVLKVKLDIGVLADTPSKAIPLFNDRLTKLLPGLKEHHCARGYRGGFYERLQEGTYLAHIFEHVALELQCLAGDDVNFGKARVTDVDGIYDVILGYKSAQTVWAAAAEAELLINAVIEGTKFDLQEAVEAIKTAGEKGRLGPSTAAIAEAAGSRNIPLSRVGSEDLLVLGYGCKQKKVWTTITSQTSALAADLASDKELTKKILADCGLVVPRGHIVTSVESAIEVWRTLGGRVVIKPANGNQGKGVTLNIATPAEIELAFKIAAEYDERVIIEEYICGRQFRVCVVNGKMAAAAERIPAYVIGDGSHTVSELVDIINMNPDRGEGHERPLTKIKIDAIAVAALGRQGFSPWSVPEKGATIYIKESANLSTGGTAVDATDIIHPQNVLMAERAAGLVGLDIAGIDLVADDIAKPIRFGNGAIIEVNAAPGIRMHHFPSAGKSRDVAGKIIEYLYPDGDDGRIPVIAVTGTNGKTTTCRMIAHAWRQTGVNTGLSTTEGIFIGNEKIMDGDTTGPNSAKLILANRKVELAVLETARGGILRGGLAFDSCDVGIVTNITADHFGQDGIKDLEDLLYIKSLVVEMVKPGGYALLNADDPCVTELAAKAQGNVVYFTTEADNLIVRRHLSIGGQAFFVKDGAIFAACGKVASPIASVADIPVTLGGIAQHNVQNAVIAAAACYCLAMTPENISLALSSFVENPGRLNMVDLGDFRVCIDYGHNPAGYQSLINTAKRMGARRLIGVIGAPGDRRDDVTIDVGRIAGRGFDYIYIKEDNDLRGRPSGAVADLLRTGALEAGMPPENITTILPEKEAVSAALSAARAGDLVVVFFEKYEEIMDVVGDFSRRSNVTTAERDYDLVFDEDKIPVNWPI